MARNLSRRSVLKAAAAGSLGYLFTGPAFSIVRAADSNSRLRFAGIGVGGKGSSDIDNAGNLGDVIALVDVDETDKFLGNKAKKWPKAKTFTDYRKLFDDPVFKDVDAVTVSTPDHHHATAAIPAMRLGKHVYVQKPLTHTVFEARMMMEVARKYKVCTQMGNQGTAANGLRRAAELLQKGELGAVKEVHVWTNRPVWPQAPKVMKRPNKTDEVPKTLHWDEFLGKAPARPYVGGRTYHDFNWRGWWDYGTGAIGDMACHTANMLFMGLKLAHPTKVSAEAGDVNPETCPSWAHVTMQFPQRGEMVPVTLHWYEGKRDNKKVLPPEELIQKALKVSGATKLVDSGSIVVGEKGIAYSPDDYGANVFFETGKKTGGDTKPETMAVNNKGDQGQKDEWVQAIKENKPALALANFDYAALLTEAFLLGNVAIRTGKAFEWDGPNMKVSGNDEAMKYIKGEYRKGWDLIGEKA
ncbi:MAG: Gfo/Idh/MocA family oxidoreductase [Fimbriiglobus sp.]|nr:Gfo/Idh/MocA family oxidoreductase [Fimbriiglobus sp.]